MYLLLFLSFFFFKQKTAYEMRISDWSSDVCSSDLDAEHPGDERGVRGAVATAHLIERVFGGVRQRLNSRQGEEARTALDRVVDAENGIELREVGGVRLPRHDRPARSGPDFRRLGQKSVPTTLQRPTTSPPNPQAPPRP